MKGYQLKITIQGSSPPIWRRVLIPTGITFSDLDQIIEYLFGWTQSHLYGFKIPKENIFITENSEYDDKDAREEIIDDWFFEKATLEYIYDFGDSWEHKIVVEKVVDYKERFPKVIKSKGPNLIEDCGGIWGFYEVFEEAEPFDLEKANAYMEKHMVFAEKNTKTKDQNNIINIQSYLKKQDQEEWDNLEEEMYLEVFEQFQKQINQYTKQLTLKEIYQEYPKNVLVDIAKQNRFYGYSRFKKAELIDWLIGKIMEDAYMEQVIRQSSRDDLELFEKVIEEGSQFFPVELLETVGLLMQYCGYIGGMLVITNDVKKKYKKICNSASWKREREKKWKLQSYVRSCMYLYGVISFKEIVHIYQSYEKKSISEAELKNICEKLIQTEENWYIAGELLMDKMLEEDQVYQDVLKEQEGLPYYLPKTKEEFLEYGSMNGTQLDDIAYSFLQFLMEEMEESIYESEMILCFIQDMIRCNCTIEEMKYKIPWSNTKNFNRRTEDMLEQYIMMLSEHTRRWENKGFTPIEREKMDFEKKKSTLNVLSNQAYEETMKIDNVISFEKEKKIYPNELCPCGSGKKYKHCCGRKKKS